MLAETREFNAALAQALAALPSVHTLPAEETRRARREGRGVFPPLVFSELATAITVPGRAGEIPVRLIEAEHPRGAYLHIHGGGWTLGSADGQDSLLEEIARRHGPDGRERRVSPRPGASVPGRARRLRGRRALARRAVRWTPRDRRRVGRSAPGGADAAPAARGAALVRSTRPISRSAPTTCPGRRAAGSGAIVTCCSPTR